MRKIIASCLIIVLMFILSVNLAKGNKGEPAILPEPFDVNNYLLDRGFDEKKRKNANLH